MSFKEKLQHGFVKKPRTREAIDAEYQHHAANIGHKLDMIREIEEQLENHRQALPKLKAEMAAANKAAQEQAKKAKPEAPSVPAPAPAPQAQAEQQVSP